MFNTSQHTIVEGEIHKLLDKGVIKVSSPEPGEFISSNFLRPKPDGSHRVILDLKQFNEYVECYHFKMNTLETAIRMMKPGCFMASIDFKDAYYTVPDASKSPNVFEVNIFNGTLYQYTSVHLSPKWNIQCPNIFAKLMKPGYALLHSQGYLNLGYMYIDDSYLQGDTYEECSQNITATGTLFGKLGFYLHPSKSVVNQTQTLVSLGFMLSSHDMTVSPTDERISKAVEACTKLKAKNKPLISEVAKVIGTLVSNFPGVQYGPLHYRQLENDKSSALKTNRGSYNSPMRLSHGSLQELDWWIQNIPMAKRELLLLTNNIAIQTDASKAEWGALSQGEVIGGRWTSTEALRHIHILELQAAFFALKSLCHTVTNAHIQPQLDNTTAVAYLNKMGGCKSMEFDRLAQEIWGWCIQRKIWVSAPHTAGNLM